MTSEDKSTVNLRKGLFREEITEKVMQSEIPDNYKNVMIEIIVGRHNKGTYSLPVIVTERYMSLIKRSPFYTGKGVYCVRYNVLRDLPPVVIESLFNFMSVREDWYQVLAKYSA